MTTDKISIELTVNGIRFLREVEPRLTLADFLRGDLELTGTHVGCEHGACGACTVLLNGKSVRSCILYAAQMSGADIVTIEGLETETGELHPVQHAMKECHGLQCGFCTPGMVLTIIELLDNEPNPSDQQVREWLSGNICRCTGYESIVDAVKIAGSAVADLGNAR
ncbi:MAG: (2Fe-2S)-binding protein [Acidimicrobiia bacterium]